MVICLLACGTCMALAQWALLRLGDSHSACQEVLDEGHSGLCHVERKKERGDWGTGIVTGWVSKLWAMVYFLIKWPGCWIPKLSWLLHLTIFIEQQVLLFLLFLVNSHFPPTAFYLPNRRDRPVNMVAVAFRRSHQMNLQFHLSGPLYLAGPESWFWLPELHSAEYVIPKICR